MRHLFYRRILDFHSLMSDDALELKGRFCIDHTKRVVQATVIESTHCQSVPSTSPLVYNSIMTNHRNLLRKGSE